MKIGESYRQWMLSEPGQGLAEYAMILALVAVVAVAALSPLGTAIANTLSSITSSL